MEEQLLKRYEIELQHLREVASEFAAAHPKIAGRLDLSLDAKTLSRDPYVNMLLEGSAHMAARVRLKLDSEFPRFTQSLLEVIFPHFLCPTPAMAIVGFEPDYADQALGKGCAVPRGTLLESQIGKSERTPCWFSTSHELVLWPVRLTNASYYATRSLEQLGLPGEVSTAAAFRFRLQSTAGLDFNQIGPKPGEPGPPFDRLIFHIRDDGQGAVRGPGRTASQIYEQIFARATALIVQFGEGNERTSIVLPASHIQRVGFSDEEAMLPAGPRSFQGYRLLKEYFAFPDRYLYFALSGLNAACREAATNGLDLIIALSEEELRLEGTEPGKKDQPFVDETRFALYTTPAVNLFPMEFDRVNLSDQFSEFSVVADRTRSVDFEVYSLEKVTAYGARPEEKQEFQPFYAARDTDKDTGCFYALYREPRALTEQEKQFGQAPAYRGCETFISLVDAKAAPFRPGLRELGFRGLCTNRHLPMTMAKGVGDTDFFPLDLGGPFQRSIRCLSGPTNPQPSAAFGETAWQLINHLGLNYLSLVDDDDKKGAATIREALRLYVDEERRAIRRQIEGLRSISAQPVIRRVESDGPITFARGLEVTVSFDEDAFAGSGIFVLGAVLEQFFARYVSLNSFTETVIRSQQRGEIVRWRARIGTLHAL